MPTDRDVTGELLSANGWDLRAIAEAQVRSLTAMQRCIEDYLKTSDPDAVTGILKHIGEIEGRRPRGDEALRAIRDALNELVANT